MAAGIRCGAASAAVTESRPRGLDRDPWLSGACAKPPPGRSPELALEGLPTNRVMEKSRLSLRSGWRGGSNPGPFSIRLRPVIANPRASKEKSSGDQLSAHRLACSGAVPSSRESPETGRKTVGVRTRIPSHDGVETNTAPRRLTAQQERRRFGIAAESASVRLVLAKHGGRAPESRPRSGDRRCSDSRSDRARRPVSAARAGRDHQRLVNRSCKPTGRRRPAPKDRASGCWRPG